MLTHDDLRQRLLRLHGQGYRAYRSIEGTYRFPQCTLFIDHVQPDPFAPPSRLCLQMDVRGAGYPPDLLATRPRRVALGDYVARRFSSALAAARVRDIMIDIGCQEVLERTAVSLFAETLQLSLTARLPAAGRSILGREAAELLTSDLPRVVSASLPFAEAGPGEARRHVQVVEDAQALRGALEDRGLVAFVADGAVLPRASGASDLPLRTGAVPFRAPPDLRVTLPTPHSGDVSGMGIPAGVTLIVGGGYHGKTTLLQALQRGVYDHLPGDGRERVVTRRDAVKVRAEDGRRVERVDISPFLSNLPFDVDTTAFSTDNASGSTSQAAAIMEALECGSRLLLLDEDTCATNFMVRDDLMQRLVPRDLEPITPFIDRVCELNDLGVSTVLVIGGDGDFFEVADRVILMERFLPRNVSSQARAIVEARRDARRREVSMPFHLPAPRIPLPASLAPESGGRRTRVGARDRDEIRLGREDIDLHSIDQIVDKGQTRAIGHALLHLDAAGIADGRRSIGECLEALDREMDERGLGIVAEEGFGEPPGNLARPRPLEVAAALNRLRTLKVRQRGTA